MTTLERRTEEKSFLKYGEHIILASFQQNLYLANRGLPFQAGVIAKSKREETINKFYLYPNLHEIVFEIHPNLNYEALMEFNECSNNDPNQDILEKRMVLEANLNHAKIEENRGKYVKLGSIVQLYHPNSKTYISFTTQKIGNSEMCAIGCSEETSESVQFTITSPFDFLKEGSLISYDDKFLFTDAYNKTLAYPISSDELESTKLRIEKKAERGILNFFGGSKEREFKIPSIIENQKLFQGHFAGAVNEKSIGFKYSNQFEAINIESSFEKNELKENDLRWGDVINIRRVDNSGKYSLMVAEVNKSSFGNNVLYRTFNQDYSSKMVNLESQFEIIHLKNKARGTSITFDKFNTVKVLLKHVLSGKFLTVDPNTQKLVLGKDYEDEFENLKRDRSKLENDYQIQYNAYMRLKEAKRFEDITKKDAPNLTQADIDFFQAHGKELIQTNKDYFKAYLIQRTFILEKVSSDESLNLNNSTFLKIRTCNNKCISISNDVEHLNLVTDDVRKKEENENFENNFFETLGRSIEQETVIASDVCDIFHFEKNEKNLVRRFNRLNSYTAFLASVLCMEEIKQSTTLQYISVVDSIESIIQKLISKKKLLKHAAQYLMVQMSTVDLLMEFLIKVKSISKESDDHLRLVTDACAVTISLLSLICENNSLVCTYMFQWRKFFTVSIVKVDNPVFKQVNIDSLLFQIVDILKCYSIYIDDYLSNLCSSIKFESLDVRKLTVLLQITKNFLHLQDPVSVDKVFEKIFNQAYKSDIFKKLEYEEMDNNRIHFLAKDERIELDEHFKENEQIYKYFLQILNLVISLGELDAAKTAKNLHEYFPKEVCIYIFTDREHRYTGEMRAAFLKLFALLYIVNLFQNNGLITYEEHITAERVRGDFRKSSETLKSLQSLKESDENRQFMGSLLSNLTSSNAELALASLQTFNLLLGFKFFDDEYVLSIKTNLDGLVVGDARRVRIEEAEHFRKEPVRDNKRLSVMPQRVESFTFEDKREDTQESPAFASDDPTTLIEVVEMLTKLHRSILRNKVLQAINQDKKSMQTEGSPRGSPSNKELTKEEAAFKRVFGSELTALNEKNEDVWKVITQWIKLKNPKLTSSILKYIFESSLMKGHFIEKYNEFFQVEDDEENSIYIRVRAYLRNFSDQLRDLMSEYSTSEFSTIRIRCSSLFKEYQALFDYFFIVMHPNDRQTKFELAIKEHNRLRVNDLIDLNAQDVFINIFNMFLMDCKNFKSKQTIIFKSGLLEIVMKTAICFNNKIFVSYPRLESEQVEKSRFRLLAEFAPEDPFKDELNTILYLILYFSLATNPENIGFLMGAYRADLQEFILAGLRSKNGVVKRVCLALLVEIYKNNISDLLKLRNDDKLFFAAVLKQVQAEIDAKQYSVLVNYIEFFAVATQFNAAILEENAKDIFNCLFDENVQDSNTVSHLINKEVPDEIREYTTILKQAQKLDISKTQSGVIFTDEQQDIDEMDERSNIFSVIELSDRMLFVSNLLALIGAFGRNCSADFKNKIQKKLSMNTLIELAASAKFNYYLKTTLVDVLANIYITTKIDQNSKSFVLDLISSIFTADLKEYFKSQSSSLTSKDIFFINKTPNADCLVLETTKRGAASCFTIRRLDAAFESFAGLSVLPLVQRFMSVSLHDLNFPLVEALVAGLNNVVKAAEKATKAVVMSLPPGAFLQQSMATGNNEQTRSRFETPAVGKMLTEDDLGFIVEDFRIKYIYLAKIFDESYKDDIVQKKIGFTRYFLKGFHYDSSGKKLVNHELFFDRLTQLMFLKDEPAEEVEIDYLDWRKAEIEQEKKNNDLLLVQKRNQNSKGENKNGKKKKNKFSREKTILFKLKTSISSLEQSSVGSPAKMSPIRKPTLGQKLKVIKLINSKQVQLGKEVLSIDDRKVRAFHHTKRFSQFTYQLLELLKTTEDNQIVNMILKYLHYCLGSPALKPIVLEVIKSENGITSILKQVMWRQPSYATLTLLNELLQTDLRLQGDLMDEFMHDFENKLVNRLMVLIEDSCNSIVELESILYQFSSFNSNGELSGELFEIETVEKTKEHTRMFIELVRFPALLCRGHNLSMQNFLRYQKVSGFVRPFQMNMIGRMRDILKKISKFISDRNLPAIRAILDLLTKLVQGPCKENQKEMVLKKVTGVLEEFFNKVIQISDEKLEIEKCKVNLSYMMLKLGIVEGSSDSLVLKTLGLSFNPEILIGRLEQIYLYLFDTTEYRQTINMNRQQAIRGDHISDDQTKIVITNAKEDRILVDGDYSYPMKEALHTIMWINTLGDFDPEITKKVQYAIEDLVESRKNLPRAMKFFKDHVRSIEIVDNDRNIQTVYFYLHPITKFLSRYSKERFEYGIDRRTWSTKLSALITAIDLLYIEMNHFASLSRYHIKANLSYLYYLKVSNLCLSLLLNVVLLLDDSVSKSASGDRVFPSWDVASPADRFVQFLGAIIVILYIIVFILWVAFEFFVKLEVFRRESLVTMDEKIRRTELSTNQPLTKAYYFYFRLMYFFQVVWSFLFNSNLLLVIGYIVVSILGLTVSKFYFSLLLLDIVDISPLIWNIIHSLTLNISTLSATAVFGIIMLFIYSSFAFFSQYLVTDLGVIDQDGTDFCETLPMCLLNMASFGLKAGGGIGEKLILPPNYNDKGRYVFRTFFDILFWVTIIILLLNIILSIIIDSFAELRNQRQTIKHDMANICFICGLSKEHFHRAEETFNLHTKKTHFMWHYVFFVVGLKAKPNELQTGFESLVELKLLEKDLTWFPLKRTKRIAAEVPEEEAGESLADLEAVVEKFAEKQTKSN
jgi:hypothetical protein